LQTHGKENNDKDKTAESLTWSFIVIVTIGSTTIINLNMR